MANLRTDKMSVKLDTMEKQLQQAATAAGASLTRYGDQTMGSKGGNEITSDPSKVTLGKVTTRPRGTRQHTQVSERARSKTTSCKPSTVN